MIEVDCGVKSNNAETLIQEAIIFASNNGFKVCPGGIFSFKNNKCNAFGAVLLKHNKHLEYKQEIPKTFLKDICAILDVNSGWAWRFTMGFDYGHIIIFEGVDSRGKDVFIKDKVSSFGYKMARSLGA